MSRVGKTVHIMPSGVSLTVKDALVEVKGPQGQLSLELPKSVDVKVDGQEVSVVINNEGDRHQRALWGTFSSLIGNMITGVNEGYQKKLEINGVGYKAALNGKDLVLSLGFSHPIDFKAREGITFTVEKNVITVSGINKQQVGEVAANIRKLRKPEPYKGKGIKYINEIIQRKIGKTAAKSGS
jgi:large subunit ribosomal protein L6